MVGAFSLGMKLGTAWRASPLLYCVDAPLVLSSNLNPYSVGWQKRVSGDLQASYWKGDRAPDSYAPCSDAATVERLIRQLPARREYVGMEAILPFINR